MKQWKKATALCIVLVMTLVMSACQLHVAGDGVSVTKDFADSENAAKDADANTDMPDLNSPEADGETVEKNGEVYILYTSDVHCGVDKGFGYAGLAQIRDNLLSQGYEVLLVDDGDSIQGELIGTLSKGEAIIKLMNDMQYDVASVGNHEFDYGMDRFLELTKMADFPYVSCNFNKEGELVFAPYVIKEAAGFQIAFVGISTPETLTTSTPKYFKNDQGEYIYGFLQDQTGQGVYDAVQKAVDDARAEGADLVYALGHLGLDSNCDPYTYADVIEHTDGIDAFLDGHSHDTEQLTAENKDGEEISRSAVGYQMNCIGYSHIGSDGKIAQTGIWSWPNKDSAPELLQIDNEMSRKVAAAMEELSEEMNQVVAKTSVELTINDPTAVDESENPIRIIRNRETNLGDLVADAYRDQSGADIAFVNGGGIRKGIPAGDITYGNIVDVHPFGNKICVIEVTGQQVLDALEWGSKSEPEEDGAFIQVSGLTYEINSSVQSSCIKDENGMFVKVAGKRKVSNVMVGDEPIDPKKTYTLAGHDYMLLDNGDGYTVFDGCKLVEDRIKLDNQVLIDYITGTLGGEVGSDYENPYGQGRITVN